MQPAISWFFVELYVFSWLLTFYSWNKTWPCRARQKPEPCWP